jgi:hypothetical protein
VARDGGAGRLLRIPAREVAGSIGDRSRASKRSAEDFAIRTTGRPCRRVRHGVCSATK